MKWEWGALAFAFIMVGLGLLAGSLLSTPKESERYETTVERDSSRTVVSLHRVGWGDTERVTGLVLPPGLTDTELDSTLRIFGKLVDTWREDN